MTCTIQSRTLGKAYTFSRPGRAYIYVDLNGQSGTRGWQICEGGRLRGDTMTYRGEDPAQFARLCRRWMRAYVRACLPTPPGAASQPPPVRKEERG